MSDQRWEVEVLGDDEGATSYMVCLEAESEDEAVRRATSEIRLALTVMSPYARITGARVARRMC